MRRTGLAITALVAVCAAGQLATAGVCLHHTLDVGVTATDRGQGTLDPGDATYDTGILGDGLRVDVVPGPGGEPLIDDATLSMTSLDCDPGGGTAYPARGTWMIWVKPEIDWATDTENKRAFLRTAPTTAILERNIYDPSAVPELGPYPALQMRHYDGVASRSYTAPSPDASWGAGKGWHFLAYTWDAATGVGEGYIDGIRLADTGRDEILVDNCDPTPACDPWSPSTLSTVALGSSIGGNDVLRGMVDEVMLVDEMLPGTTIREVYEAYRDPTADPVAIADAYAEPPLPSMTGNLIPEGARFEAGVDGFDIVHRVLYDASERNQGGFAFTPATFEDLGNGTDALRLDIDPGEEARVQFDAVSISPPIAPRWIQVCVNARVGVPPPGSPPDPYIFTARSADGRLATEEPVKAAVRAGGTSQTTLHFNLRQTHTYVPRMSGSFEIPTDGYFHAFKVVSEGMTVNGELVRFGEVVPPSGAWRPDQYEFYVLVRKTDSAGYRQVYLDDISVIAVDDPQGVPCAAPPPTDGLAFSLSADAEYAIYDVGQTAAHTVRLFNFNGAQRQLDLHTEVRDWRGDVVWTDDRQVTVGANADADVALGIPTAALGHERGFFVVESTASDGGPLETERASFAVVEPVDRAQGAPPIPLGTHLKIHNLVAPGGSYAQGGYPTFLRQSLPGLVDAAKRAGFERIREFGALSWSNVEATQDTFSWFDSYVDFLTVDNGMKLYGILGSASPIFPGWVCAPTEESCQGTGALTPGDRGDSCLIYDDPQGMDGLQQWSDYLTAVFDHYGDRFESYEVVNEPSFHYYPCEYYPMLEAAVAAHAASAASGTNLVAPATGSGVAGGNYAFLADLAPLATVAGAYDEHSEHFYPGTRFPEGSLSNPLVDRIDKVRPYAQALALQNKPAILDSESGYKVRPVADLRHFQHDGLPPELGHYFQGANEVRHTMIETFAADEPGVAQLRRYQFALQSTGRSHLLPTVHSLIEFDGTPGGGYPAIAAYNGIVGASSPRERLASTNPFLEGFSYDGEDGDPLIVVADWDYRVQNLGTRTIDVCYDPADVEVRDLYGNPITPTAVGGGFRLTLEPGPTYVIGRGNKAQFRSAMSNALAGSCSL